MTQLEQFPIQNQLADASEPNKAFDCVPTCIAACLTYLLGASYDGAALKDAVYGRDYVGATAASAYVAYCASHGVRLAPLSGAPEMLIAAAHQALLAGKPSLITIPDPYMPAGSGWTHVEVFHADGAGVLTALDPYGGKDITKSDAEWAGLLQDEQLWILERMTMNTVPMGWHDDGHTLTAPNGHRVVFGFRDYILAHNWDAQNEPLEEESGLNPLEGSNPTLGAGTRQVFRLGALEYTAARGVFPGWIGQELLWREGVYGQIYAAYQAQKQQIAALTAKVAQLEQNQPPDQSSIVTELQAALAEISGYVASISGVLANPLKS